MQPVWSNTCQATTTFNILAFLIGHFQGLRRFREALSDIYSPSYGRTLDPDKEISVHSGGTEAILSTITAFVEPGDEVIVLEPAFDL